MPPYVIAFMLSLVFAVLVVVGVRITYLLICASGVALMVGIAILSAIFIPGWWLGGIYFVLGAVGFAAAWGRVQPGN